LSTSPSQIVIEPKPVSWESVQVCYVDSLYYLIYSKEIRELYLTTENKVLEINYGILYPIAERETIKVSCQWVAPDTYFLSFKIRLVDFRVNLILETESETIEQQLRLYLDERKIIVYRDIRPQKMFVFEGDSLVAEFSVSTGRKGRQTALGRHRILTKKYRAWYGEGGFWMTWWQSFAVIGRLRNGFHASSGEDYQKFLGQPTSAGCVRVSRTAGQWLYHWTDIDISFEINTKP